MYKYLHINVMFQLIHMGLIKEIIYFDNISAFKGNSVVGVMFVLVVNEGKTALIDLKTRIVFISSAEVGACDQY